MSADPGENEAKSGNRADFPHLAWLVDDEHDPTGEIEAALNEIDRLRQREADLEDAFNRAAAAVERRGKKIEALRAACVVAQEDADRLAAAAVRLNVTRTDWAIPLSNALAAHVSAVASREVTT